MTLPSKPQSFQSNSAMRRDIAGGGRRHLYSVMQKADELRKNNKFV
jgi:hypothetical protein